MRQARRSETALENYRAVRRIFADPFSQPQRFFVRPRVAASWHFVRRSGTGRHRRSILSLAAQDSRNRIVNPWIDLQIAISGGGKTQLNRAVGTDKGPLRKTRGIFDAYT
jgi:hypothetical protein